MIKTFITDVFKLKTLCNIGLQPIIKEGASAPFFLPTMIINSTEKMTKKKIKELRQIVLGVGSLIIIMGILAYCLNYMNPKQNVLEELEEKIKKVEQKEIILTEHEKELEKKATEKEWQEVDNSTDK